MEVNFQCFIQLRLQHCDSFQIFEWIFVKKGCKREIEYVVNFWLPPLILSDTSYCVVATRGCSNSCECFAGIDAYLMWVVASDIKLILKPT